MAQEGGPQDRADELRSWLIEHGEQSQRELDEQARYEWAREPLSKREIDARV